MTARSSTFWPGRVAIRAEQSVRLNRRSCARPRSHPSSMDQQRCMECVCLRLLQGRRVVYLSRAAKQPMNYTVPCTVESAVRRVPCPATCDLRVHMCRTDFHGVRVNAEGRAISVNEG